MTKIDKKETDVNMHSHNEVLDFLDQYLKRGYTSEAIKRLKEKGIEMSASMIRNIKHGNPVNWIVLEVLAEIALESKSAKDRVNTLIQ